VENFLLNLIEEDIDLKSDDREKIRLSLQEAVQTDTLRFIYRDNIPVGFYSWKVYSKGIFINNLFILKGYRNRDNLLYLRNWFREKMVNGKFYWKNRKTKQYTPLYS
jgi:hypothetical protein